MILGGDPKDLAKLGIKPGQPLSEAEIQRRVLNELKGRSVPNSVWFHVPHNPHSRRSVGFRAGVSDLIMLNRGEAFALELKADNGRATEAQMKFMSDWNAAGGCGCIAEGLDQAIASLELWGLLRRAS
jgi:hypothetical protein